MHGIQYWSPVALLVLGLFGCGREPASAPAVPPSVQTLTVSERTVQPKAEFVGRTRAFEDVTLQPQISGQVLERHFNEGQTVSAGDLLFTIDPESYRSEVTQAEALLEQAIAARDVAVLNWERGRRLHPDGMISDNDMDELTARKLQSEAQVGQLQAALERAQLQLSYTQVKAPIDGRISVSLVATGDLVTPQTDLATLVQADPIYVFFQTSEREATRVRRMISNSDEEIDLSALPVAMVLPDGERFDQQGVIDFVDNRVDAATGTIAIRARFPNPNRFLVPGMYVNVELSSPNEEKRLLVPQSAVQEDQQGRYVMVVDKDNTVNKRIIELRDRFGIDWAVTRGLEPGEQIVVEGLQKIRPGAVVTPVAQEAQPFQSETQR
ncbi:multidrug efflux RND transporter periplasmic adaptor subunit VmeY [Ferrimonas gelatinilytica]|uniref:Multidrug efflux RND transporter periplasmic adaptor subunit VmeY n=2 Tax=Ferrimonas gelatinilytica TaxID=1255257 RepID=A0ABP9S1G6_9GAMM